MPKKVLRPRKAQPKSERTIHFDFDMTVSAEGFDFTPKPKLYRYFIACVAAHSNHQSHFMVETKTPYRIKGIQELRLVARSIEEQFNVKQGTLIILNYKLFEEE